MKENDKNMSSSMQEKVDRTMDFIDRDRILAEDPVFSARLMAKAQHYFSGSMPVSPSSRLFSIKLRPVLAAAILATGIIAGIFLGSSLARIPGQRSDIERVFLLDHFSRENYLTEINGSFEERIIPER